MTLYRTVARAENDSICLVPEVNAGAATAGREGSGLWMF